MQILFVYPMGKQKNKAWGPLWAQALREQARSAKKRPGEKSRAFLRVLERIRLSDRDGRAAGCSAPLCRTVWEKR